MVFAIAALFLQMQAAPAAILNPVEAQPSATKIMASASSTTGDSSLMEDTSSEFEIYDNDGDPDVQRASSVAHLNLGSVHLDTKNNTTSNSAPVTLSSINLPAGQNTQSFSNIHIPELKPEKPYHIAMVESMPSRRAWWILSATQHGAAAFDAYTTRGAISRGAVENDPLMRPFAHSPALYAAIQVGPLAFDYAARRMQRSQNNFVRHMWWMPQSLSTAAFLFSGAHNLHVARLK